MTKLKTHSGAKKRFKIAGKRGARTQDGSSEQHATTRIKRRAAYRSHCLDGAKKSNDAKRHARMPKSVSKHNLASVLRLLVG